MKHTKNTRKHCAKTRHFFFIKLEKNKKNKTLDGTFYQTITIQHNTMQYLAASHASLPRWVVTKLGKALVDVGKVSWPQEDPKFLDDLQQLARCYFVLVPILILYSRTST